MLSSVADASRENRMSSLQLDPKRFRRHAAKEAGAAVPGELGGSDKVSGQPTRKTGYFWPAWFKPLALLLLVIVGMLCLAIWQKAAPDGWRLSQLWGFFGGDLEAAKIKALEEDKIRFEGRLKELEAKLIREKADAERMVVEATKAAESLAQQQILRAQAEKEACVAQVAAAFEMIKAIAAQNTQASTTMARSYLDQEIAKTGGQVGVANLLSMFSAGAAAFGRQDIASQLESHRQMISSQSAQAVQSAIEESARIIANNQAAFLRALPDSETLLKGAGCRVNPEAQRPPDRPQPQWPTSPTTVPPKF